jgi:hypothetical protein
VIPPSPVGSVVRPTPAEAAAGSAAPSRSTASPSRSTPTGSGPAYRGSTTTAPTPSHSPLSTAGAPAAAHRSDVRGGPAAPPTMAATLGRADVGTSASSVPARVPAPSTTPPTFAANGLAVSVGNQVSRQGLAPTEFLPAVSSVERAGLLGPWSGASRMRATALEPGSSGGSTRNPMAPAPPEPSAPGLGASAGNGGGGFFFAFFAVLGLLALTIPQLDRRFRLLDKLGRPLPFVLLLDRPG